MWPSADCERIVLALERSCARSEAAITANSWETLHLLLNEQRRLTHALSIAIVDYDKVGDAQLKARLQKIIDVRDAQCRRVTAVRDRIGARLRMIAQGKALRRAMGPRPAATRLGHLDTLR